MLATIAIKVVELTVYNTQVVQLELYRYRLKPVRHHLLLCVLYASTSHHIQTPGVTLVCRVERKNKCHCRGNSISPISITRSSNKFICYSSFY